MKNILGSKTKLLLMATVFLLSIFTINVNAEDSVDTTVKVTKTINNVGTKVNNTYTYKITPDASNVAPVTGLTDQFTIEFNNVTAENGVAKMERNIDFNSVTYTKPGNYIYNIKEIASSDSTSYPVTNDEWKVIISVRYKVIDGTPTREKVVKSVVIEDPNGDKSDNGINFIGTAKFSSILITETTNGNMADLDKYFKIEVKIDGNPGDTYTITGQDPTVNYEGSTITTSNVYTVGSDPQYVYLKHNQRVTIGNTTLDNCISGMSAKAVCDLGQIKIGTTYKIEEEGAEAYETYINGSTTPNKQSETQTLTEEQGKLDIVNTYNVSILTGFMKKWFGYVLMVIVAITMLVIIKVTGKKPEPIEEL